ncbi:MAG: S-layer homology domain-containing protein [Bacillota bacterium]
MIDWLKLVAGFLTAALMLMPAAPAGAVSRFHVYYPVYLQSGSFVVPVEFLSPPVAAPARAALERLIAGSGVESVLPRMIPTDTEILGLNIRDGVCTVDLGGGIRRLNVGSGGEAAVVAALVSTLGQFSSVNSVRILVEGQSESLAGHVDITKPIAPDRSWVFRTFSDVEQHWAGGTVALLQLLDIVNGYEDGTFKPDRTLTRAEFVKMLVEAIDIPNALNQNVPFQDIEGHWVAQYVKRAVASGLFSVDDYGPQFRPDETIAREEMAWLAVRASDAYRGAHSGAQPTGHSNPISFRDASQITLKYFQWVQEAVKRGLLLGYPDGSFRPASGLTRAEASTVVARVLGISGKNVLVLAPRPGVTWQGGDLVVLGAAAAFEGTVNFRLKDESGGVLLESYTTSTNGTGWGVFGFAVRQELFGSRKPAQLQLYLVSPKYGSEYSTVTVALGD